MKSGLLGLLGALALTTAMAPAHPAPVRPGPVPGRPAGPTVQTVTITIHYSAFSPAQVSVRRGSTVAFRVVNTDPIDHEFILGDAALQAREEAGTDVVHNGMVPGEVSVPAGMTATTVVTFPRTGPAGPATLPFACHLPGHYAYGMRGLVLLTG